MADALERLSAFTGKGIRSVSAFDDAILSMTGMSPAKAVVESVLIAVAKHQSAKAVRAKGISSTADALHVPGRVQSRINLRNGSHNEGAGWNHLTHEHYSSVKNKSQFTISQKELRKILQSEVVVRTPVSKVLSNKEGMKFVREVDVGKNVGTDKFNDFSPTTKMVVMTDEEGNLVSAYPGRLE